MSFLNKVDCAWPAPFTPDTPFNFVIGDVPDGVVVEPFPYTDSVSTCAASSDRMLLGIAIVGLCILMVSIKYVRKTIFN